MAGVQSFLNTVDAYKRKAGQFVQDMQDVGPKEYLRQYVANANQQAGENLDKLSTLYKDPSGNVTFDPNKWSPQAASNEADLSDQATGAVIGATAWHGTPHVLDRFDATKIGSGEGAQAKGYGHYTAANRNVGEAYADTVTAYRNDEMGPFNVAGQKFDPNNPAHVVAQAVDNNKGRVNDAAHEIWDSYVNARKYDVGDRLNQTQAQAGLDYLRRYGAGNLPDVTATVPYNKNLYKLDIPDAHINNMLNWDANLVDQRPEVLEKLGWTGGSGAMDDMKWEASQGNYGIANRIGKASGIDQPLITGGMLHQDLQSQLGSEQAASAQLASQGLSGARHLDAFSRVGNGLTSNYVVFPEYEDIIKILGKETLPPDKSWGPGGNW